MNEYVLKSIAHDLAMLAKRIELYLSEDPSEVETPHKIRPSVSAACANCGKPLRVYWACSVECQDAVSDEILERAEVKE